MRWSRRMRGRSGCGRMGFYLFDFFCRPDEGEMAMAPWMISRASCQDRALGHWTGEY